MRSDQPSPCVQPCRSLCRAGTGPRQDGCSALLNSPHLIHRHPEIAGNNAGKWTRVVAVLETFFRGFQQSAIKVVVELLGNRQGFARNTFQRGQALMQMFDAPLDAFGGIVAPATILPVISNERGHHRVVVHPALPIFVKIGAEFSRCFGWTGTRLSARRQGHHKEHAACGKRQRQECTNHGSPPATPANSLPRSWASMTIKRAVSSMPIAETARLIVMLAQERGKELAGVAGGDP